MASQGRDLSEPQVAQALLRSGEEPMGFEDALEAEQSTAEELLAPAEPPQRRSLPWRTVAIGTGLISAAVVAVHFALPSAAALLGAARANAAAGLRERTISSQEVGSKTLPLRGMLTIGGDEVEPCFVKERAYNPLDMLNAIPLTASGPVECQERCAAKSGCEYFSFDHLSMLCHLEDKSATLGPTPVAFISGPAVCPTTSTATATTTITTATITTGTTTPTTKPTTLPSTTPKTTTPTTTAATHPPTTHAPTTHASTTHASTTHASTTHAPTTQAPTTHAPTTHAPSTHAPSTHAPTTHAPTTHAPTTQAPTTQAPTTQEPKDYLPALYCFMLVMPTGYEPDLVRAQVAKHASVFSCKLYDVFSTATVDLGYGVVTVPIGADLSKKGPWGSWLNTENFLQVWDQILQQGKFKTCDWTVKADPDAVFMPDRLQLHLKSSFPGGTTDAFYIKNCPKSFGLMGVLEVFSTGAIEAFGKNRYSCRAKFHPESSGEDGYIQACMESSGAVGKEDFSLLVDNYCGFGQCSGNTWNVAFHPYKDVNSWFECWNQVVAAR